MHAIPLFCTTVMLATLGLAGVGPVGAQTRPDADRALEEPLPSSPLAAPTLHGKLRLSLTEAVAMGL